MSDTVYALYFIFSYYFNKKVYNSVCALTDRASAVPKLASPKRYLDYALDDAEWTFLELVARVLKEPASAAQSFSQTGNRSLHRVVPVLEMIQDLWESYIADKDYADIKDGLQNIRKRYRKTDDMNVYVLAMCKSPMLQLV
jgi:hypothetical protein